MAVKARAAASANPVACCRAASTRKRGSDMNLFEPDDDFDNHMEFEPREKCTEEKLLEFIKASLQFNKRYPTLQECKKQFGGILAAMVVGWRLNDKGLL